MIDKILSSHFCQNCLNVEERNEFIEDVFNKIMKEQIDKIKWIHNEFAEKVKEIDLRCGVEKSAVD